MFIRCPHYLHTSYHESSLLLRPGTAGNMTTLSRIKDEILSFRRRFWDAEVKNVNSQGSVNGGIIVAVKGCLIGAYGGAKWNFNQTFFLGKKDRRFFVLNDILQVDYVRSTCCDSYRYCGSVSSFYDRDDEVYYSVFTDDHKSPKEDQEEEEILLYRGDTRLHDNWVKKLKSKIRKSYRGSSRKLKSKIRKSYRDASRKRSV